MGGGGSKAPAPEKVDPVKQAEANLQAQINTMPGAAKVQYDILNSPEYGLTPTTQAYENTRQSVYPEETKVRNQLVQNVLMELMSPTGLTGQQQGAIDSRRGLAQNQLTESIRNRQNLGGGLYGGRGQAFEARQVGELQNQFAEEDINRQERSKLNNSQLAMAVLQFLYPQSGIQQPNFVNPVASADTQYGGAVSQNNLTAQLQQQQNQAQAALRSSLFQALGGAAGAVGGSMFGAGGVYGKTV